MSSTTVLDRLRAMDDFRVVRFFQYWADSLCEGAITDIATIIEGVPDQIREDAEYAQITELAPDRLVEPIHPAVAAPLARAILEPLARSPELCQSLEPALDTFDDDKLAVDVILALGLVASVLMIVSTIEFDGKIGPFNVHKGKVDPETLKIIIRSVFGLVAPQRGAPADE